MLEEVLAVYLDARRVGNGQRAPHIDPEVGIPPEIDVAPAGKEPRTAADVEAQRRLAADRPRRLTYAACVTDAELQLVRDPDERLVERSVREPRGAERHEEARQEQRMPRVVAATERDAHHRATHRCGAQFPIAHGESL
jgi:hypothetical protein